MTALKHSSACPVLDRGVMTHCSVAYKLRATETHDVSVHRMYRFLQNSEHCDMAEDEQNWCISKTLFIHTFPRSRHVGDVGRTDLADAL